MVEGSTAHHDSHGNKTLGQRIRSLRKQRKMTQAELCRGLVSPSMISQIEADKISPSNTLLLNLAKRLGVEGDFFADGARRLADFVQIYRKGRALMEVGKYEEALRMIQSVIHPLLSLYGKNVLYGDLAKCHEYLGNLSEAVEIREDLIRAALDTDDIHTAVQGYYEIGSIYRRHAQLPFAKMYLQRAGALLEHFPNVQPQLGVKLFSGLAHICEMLCQKEAAIEYYHDAARMAEMFESWLELASSWHALANLYLETRQYSEALFYNEKALGMYETVRTDRGVNECRVNLGIVLNRSGHPQKAIQYFNGLFQDDQKFSHDTIRCAEALTEKASAHFRLCQFDNTIQDAESALASHQSSIQILAGTLLANALLKSNRPAHALERLETVLEFLQSADNATNGMKKERAVEALILKQQALLGLGRKSEALRCSLAVATILHPKNRKDANDNV